MVFLECLRNSFFPVRCIIPLFHPPIGAYTHYFSTLGAVMDFRASSVGAGALIPYKRGDDDVGWFISYSHS